MKIENACIDVTVLSTRTRQVEAYRYPGYAGDLAIKSKKQTIANLSTRGQHLPDQWKFFVFAMESSGGFTKEAHVILQRMAKLWSERSGLPYHILMERMVRRLNFICVRETARLFARALRTDLAAPPARSLPEMIQRVRPK